MKFRSRLSESMSRFCLIQKASDGKWYLYLADEEYGGPDDATAYGPFVSEEAADQHLENFANPGAVHFDRTGQRPAPKKSPNGKPLQAPSVGRRYSFPRYGYR